MYTKVKKQAARAAPFHVLVLINSIAFRPRITEHRRWWQVGPDCVDRDRIIAADDLGLLDLSCARRTYGFRMKIFGMSKVEQIVDNQSVIRLDVRIALANGVPLRAIEPLIFWDFV